MVSGRRLDEPEGVQLAARPASPVSSQSYISLEVDGEGAVAPHSPHLAGSSTAEDSFGVLDLSRPKRRVTLSKSTVSNSLSVLLLVACILAFVFLDRASSTTRRPGEADDQATLRKVVRVLFSGFLFAFAGGLTNWLAVHMLFHKVPGLYGSGVIPRHFASIRESLKRVIMNTFFSKDSLDKYLAQQAGALASDMRLEESLRKVLQSSAVDEIIDGKLQELSGRPEGMCLTMLGIRPSTLKPMIKPFVASLGADVAPLLSSAFEPTKLSSGGKLRGELERLMTARLNDLTPAVTKQLIEDVVSDHLGWLVVWGNVFGFFLGVLSEVISQVTHFCATV